MYRLPVPDLNCKPASAGLYIHIPFCLNKCPYCYFYSITDLSSKEKCIQALLSEMDLYEGISQSFDSIYFGGGTPSLLSPDEISQILRRVFLDFTIKTDTEITLEVNPGTIDYEKLSRYKKAGINRLNIGVQSFSEKSLKFLGRIHSAEQSRTAIETARRSGFDNVGIDLIYCLPNQRPGDWEKELEQAISYKPEHISCYTLTVEPGTPLSESMRNGLYTPLNEDLSRDMFLFTISFLKAYGYTQYEISNFFRAGGQDEPDFRSRHNRKYWDFKPYLGLGPSAHSFLKSHRFWNHSSVLHYIQALREKKFPVAAYEKIDYEKYRMETVLLGLRKKEGIHLKSYRQQFGRSLPEDKILRLQNSGCLYLYKDRCALTPEGMCVLDGICELLIG